MIVLDEQSDVICARFCQRKFRRVTQRGADDARARALCERYNESDPGWPAANLVTGSRGTAERLAFDGSRRRSEELVFFLLAEPPAAPHRASGDRKRAGER
jgi:hypothetical protein